uniref:Uncharacterized protein n=1 Tax=Seriola dumerili TaxID=41447 RepID=A0A3B4UEK9_SERDU
NCFLSLPELEKPDAPLFQEPSPYLLLYPQLAPSPEMSPDLPLLGWHYFHERSSDIEFLLRYHRNFFPVENKYSSVHKSGTTFRLYLTSSYLYSHKSGCARASTI